MITYENGMLMRSVPQADRKQGNQADRKGSALHFGRWELTWFLQVDADWA